MLLVKTVALHIGHAHLLGHPFWLPDIALLVPIAFFLGEICMDPSVAMQLVIAARALHFLFFAPVADATAPAFSVALRFWLALRGVGNGKRKRDWLCSL